MVFLLNALGFLTHQPCRINVALGRKFLDPANVHVGDVEIALLIDTELMWTPKRTRKRAEGSPGVQQLPGQIVLQDLIGTTIPDPHMLVLRDVNVVGKGNVVPYVQKVALRIEDLNA